jgi:predicted dehydrogenase
MAEKLRWGILGNAAIARICVIPAIAKSRNGVIYALGTRNPAGARKLATEHNIGHVYDTLDAVVGDPDVEAVYIPLPNHLHLPWTIKALRAGKHVLCEKPLACNADQAREMAAVSRETGCLLMEALMYRFHPRTRQIKRIIESGQIGQLRLVRSSFCSHMDDGVLESGENYRLAPDQGGGCLLDVGCYSISLACWLFNRAPESVQAQALYHPAGCDIHLTGSLMFSPDGLAALEASFISALQQTFTASGSEGVIELPHDAFIPWEHDAVFWLRGKDEETGQEHIVPGADEYQLMVEHFGDAVLNKTTCELNLDASIQTMTILDALAESAKTGTAVTLNS